MIIIEEPNDGSISVGGSTTVIQLETGMPGSIPGPVGPQGIQGEVGPVGATGPAPFTLQGEYNNGITYTVGDAVTYAGSLYVMTVFIGSAGYIPPAYPSNWLLLASNGDTGATGPAGADGMNGVGVPAGGSAGQILVKVDGVDYNTEWVNNLDLTGYATESWVVGLVSSHDSSYRSLVNFDFTNLNDIRLNTFGLTLAPATEETAAIDSFLQPVELHLKHDTSQGGTTAGYMSRASFNIYNAYGLTETWTDDEGMINTDGGYSYLLNKDGLFFGKSGDFLASGTVRYSRDYIQFGNGSTQTIAFPGFNNAALTGNPTAPTATFGDDDTSIATTAFVQAGLLGGTANARNLEFEVRNQSGSTIAAGSIVYLSGATGNLPLITLAQANNDTNSAQTIGFVKTAITNNGTGYVIVRGVLQAINTSTLTEGAQLYLSPTTAGTWTTTKPSAPQHLVYVGVVIRSHPTLGTILVAVQNGYELHELHDAALSSEANNDLLAYESSTDLWKNKTFSALGLLTSADAASTYQTQAGMSSYLTTASAASTYQTQAGMSSYALLNSPAFTGDPTAPTQSVNDNSTRLMTTAGLRDNLMDCAWSVPPIVSTTTVTSGTGASYVNASPDYGYAVGPNANLAGFCQKNFTMFARSNSTYGFNFTKSIKVGCKVAVNWSGTFTAITQTLFFRLNTGTTNGTLTQIGFGISINLSTKALSILAHNGTTLTTKATSWTPPAQGGIASIDFMVESNGAGTVFAYADGVLIDSTTGMSTATASGTTSALAAVEINSAGGTSTNGATAYVCNLRTFVAHG